MDISFRRRPFHHTLERLVDENLVQSLILPRADDDLVQVRLSGNTLVQADSYQKILQDENLYDMLGQPTDRLGRASRISRSALIRLSLEIGLDVLTQEARWESSSSRRSAITVSAQQFRRAELLARAHAIVRLAGKVGIAATREEILRRHPELLDRLP